MTLDVRFLLTFLLISTTVASPRLVRACDPPEGQAVQASFPEDGATDVPTNVSPIILGSAKTITAVNEKGESLNLTLDRPGTGLEIHFDRPLDPNTQYTLVADEEDSITFTTGSGAAEPAHPAFEPILSAVVADTPGTCNVRNQLCVHADLSMEYALAVRIEIGGGVGTTIVPPSTSVGPLWTVTRGTRQFFNGWTGAGCVEVTTRHLDGSYGEWLEYCAGDFEVLTPEERVEVACEEGLVTVTDDEGVVTTAEADDEEVVTTAEADDGGTEPPDAGGGCSTTRGPAGSSSSPCARLGWLLALGLLLRHRRIWALAHRASAPALGENT